MKPKVLLLGSNGFIGSALKVHLSSYYEIMVFKNRNIDSLGNLSKTTIDYVVNCSASKLSDNFEESYNANIGYQISVFSKLFQECVQIPKWIQVASYYELQTFFGRSDNYSNHKKIFRRILETAYPLGSLNYSSIFLPHIFGQKEKSERLISKLIWACRRAERIEISRGNQFLPILELEDACSAIIYAMKSDQKICAAQPIWHGRVKEIAEVIQTQIGKGQLVFSYDKPQIDDSFPQVIFPEVVSSWLPDYSFNKFLTELREPK